MASCCYELVNSKRPISLFDTYGVKKISIRPLVPYVIVIEFAPLAIITLSKVIG